MTKYYKIENTEGSLEEAFDVYSDALSKFVIDMNLINELYLLINSEVKEDIVKYISSEFLRKIYLKNKISEESYVHINNQIINFNINDKIAKKDYNDDIVIPIQNRLFKLFIQETFYFFSIFKIEFDDDLINYKQWNSWNNKR